MGLPRPRAALAALLAAGAGACDIPTELPKGWDVELQVEVDGLSLSVAELLPGSVSITSDGSAFALALGVASLDESLAGLCPPCEAARGLTVPKPAFQGSFGNRIELPADVDAVTLSGGRVRVTITNGLNFDPLRPGGAENGSIRIDLTSGLSPVAVPLIIHGDQQALPPGSSLTRDVQLAAVTISTPIEVDVTVDSPQGAPVRMQPELRVSALAIPQDLRIASATVQLEGRQIESDPTELDLTDVDEEIVSRIRRGSLLLDVDNPFNVRGSVAIRFTGPGVAIVKALELRPGVQEQEIAMSGEELRQILGTNVVVSMSGAVWSEAGGLTVTPAQTLEVASRIHLVVGPKLDG